MADLANDVRFGDDAGQHAMEIAYDQNIGARVAQKPRRFDELGAFCNRDKPLAGRWHYTLDEHHSVPPVTFLILAAAHTARPGLNAAIRHILPSAAFFGEYAALLFSPAKGDAQCGYNPGHCQRKATQTHYYERCELSP